jgi:hypothetical protein
VQSSVMTGLYTLPETFGTRAGAAGEQDSNFAYD